MPAVSQPRLDLHGTAMSSSLHARGALVPLQRHFMACAFCAVAGVGTTAGCVFTPPPPLPGELAGVDVQGDQGDAGAEGEGSPPGGRTDDADVTTPSNRAFTVGEVAPPGMSAADRLAYNLSQGDPVTRALVDDGERFGLDQALEGLPGEGQLVVIFETARGPMRCELFEEVTPHTVANFVGLARGVRPFREQSSGAWKRRPYYDDILFHRVIPGFMIQSGDPSGTGRFGAGYVIQDEIVEELIHDRAGRLSMANRGPGTGSAQFFVTLGPTPHLDGLHTIFGQCDPDAIELAKSIASVPRDDADKPLTTEPLERVVIARE